MPGDRRKRANSAGSGAAAGAGASGTKRGRKKKAGTSNDEEQLPQAPTAAAAAAASATAAATNSSSSSTTAGKRKELLRTQFDTLDAEMELVGYGKNERGQNKRKLPRKQSLVRTQKRKVLDRQDREERAIQADVIRPKRLRGAKVAFEDEVIGGSMIFGGDDNDDGGAAAKPAAAAAGSTDGDEEGDEAWETGMASSSAGDNDTYSGGSRSPSPVPPSSTGGQRSPATSSSKSKRARGGQRVGREDALEEAREAIRTGSTKISRTMYRLKNFKSHKLVERQGQALGAHARGEHKEAIAKLAEVAEAAPLAPQVYSTLGLVYENMLREKKTEDIDTDGGGDGDRNDEEGGGTASAEASSTNNDAATSETVGGQKNKAIHSKLEIAKKAYGSYHIAAVMCKKDFTLWVRAGDAALDIADMYSDLITSGDCSTTDLVDYRVERKKWMSEAKNDFQAADNLQPPGISIPSKLAAVQMELGNLSEALTILTDCNNQSQSMARTSGGARSDMEKSYGVWLLYADLMLRIGFGCQQWNKGNHSNDNYMFRRWLRKYSKTFDWKERRLQALCMALEAAAGSSACSKLVEWLRLRASKSRSANDGQSGGSTSGGFDSDRWKVSDTYESDQQKEKADEAATDEGDSENGGGINATAKSAEAEATKMTGDGKNEMAPSPQDGQSFEEKRAALLSANRAELLAFDEETKRLGLSADSEESREREMSRSDLVKKHRLSVVALVGEHYQNEQAKKDRAQASQSGADGVGADVNTSRDPLPMSASCATVCNIAAQLMKQCIDLELFQGSSLVGEVVSSYLKERVQRRERKPSIPDNNPFFLSQNPFEMHLTYDNIDVNDASDSEDSMVEYFSDDEELDSPSKAGAIEGMRNGVLPDELQVLVGISLLAEGGKRYAAQRALSAITRLQDDSAITTQSAGGYLSDWSLFSHPLVGVTTETSFFALTAGLVRRMGNEKAKNCLDLIPLFEEHIGKMEQRGFLEGVATSASTGRIPGNGNFPGEEKKAKTREIFLSLLKLLLIRAREESLHVGDSNENFENRYKNSLALLDFVIQYEDIIWDGRIHASSSSLLPTDSEVLGVLSEVFSTLVAAKEAETSLTPSSAQSPGMSLGVMDPVLAKLRHIMSVFLCISMDVTPPEAENTLSLVTNSTLPLLSSWQSASQKNLSRRAFNLCVGYAVPPSNLAWRPDGSFLLEAIMKASGDSNFFGISLSYDETDRAWVCGILPEKVELELASQLQMLQSGGFVETSIWDEFNAAFQTIKETDWYSRATDKLQRQGGREILSRGGEEAGMNLLLLLSRSYLTIAKVLDPNDASKKQNMIKMVLSIVLPIAQFCTGKRMWNSNIGTCIMTEPERKEWNRFVDTRLTFEGLPLAEEPSVEEPRRRRKPSQPPRIKVAKASAPPPPARGDIIQNTIRISSSALLKEWLKESVTSDGGATDEDDRGAAAVAKELMATLNEALKALHKSTTLPSMQKSSLKVASALLNVANQPNCYNPFQCLQHAVMFASNGPKLGKNDVFFKKALPENDLQCSPIEALMILGRADCLRALHFTDEAIFLCGHVLSLCSKQRERIPPAAGIALTPSLPSKWSAVNAYAYMVSIATDSTLSSLLHACNREVTTMNWDKEALEEIAHGRAAAMRIGGISDLPLIGSVQSRTASTTNTKANPSVGAGRRQDEAEEYDNWEDSGSGDISGVDASSGAAPPGLQELSNEDYYEGGDDEDDDQVEMVAV